MKANEAPEKIYLTKLMLFAAPTISSSDNDIEYTRTNTFIEKAWNWIEDNLLSSNQQDKSRLYCEKFINYMEGE